MQNIKISSYVIIVLLILLPSLVSASDAENENGWITSFDDATETAILQDKLIFTYFSGSDWCRPCITLKSTILETDQFKTFAESKFVMLQLDFPVKKENLLPEEIKKHNEDLAEKYNNTGAFPLVVLIKSDGSVVGEISGYSHETLDSYIKKINLILHNNE